MERYLAVVRQAPVRRLVTRLRCAVLRLRVEEGRYEERRAEQQGRQLTEAEKQQLRHCPICPGCVEDEVHFVMACGAYQQHREQLWQTLHGHFGDKWTSVGAAAAGGAGGEGWGPGWRRGSGTGSWPRHGGCGRSWWEGSGGNGQRGSGFWVYVRTCVCVWCVRRQGICPRLSTRIYRRMCTPAGPGVRMCVLGVGVVWCECAR